MAVFKLLVAVLHRNSKKNSSSLVLPLHGLSYEVCSMLLSIIFIFGLFILLYWKYISISLLLCCDDIKDSSLFD